VEPFRSPFLASVGRRSPVDGCQRSGAADPTDTADAIRARAAVVRHLGARCGATSREGST
jgi:hypothetical protein